MNTQRSTFRILFYLKKTKILQNGETPVYMRITASGQRAEIATHRSVNPKLWNQDKGQVSSVSPKANDVNNYLDLLRNKVFSFKQELEENDQIVTARLLGDMLQGKGRSKKSLIDLFTDHNTQCRERIGKDFATATVVRYETTLRHVEDFILQKYRQEDLPLRSINPQFIRDFEHYLKTARECSHNSAVRYIRNLRKIILIALAYDYINKDPFRAIKYRLKDVHRDYLSEVELKILMEKDFSHKRLQRVKEIFLFCCFTGLAFSDVKSLTQDNITPTLNLV